MSQTAFSKEDIFQTLIRHTREIVPDLESYEFQPGDSLKNLGANSVDRADIIMSTLESLELDIPLVEMATARNMDELAGLIHAKA